ncbi:unnamed protein product [Adineta steineri]|uniref:G domain-containing protein n=1 Tax=Adineta steineri TaxID=433720 RepID=A0A814FJB1_9BILA|nr:unnamed protein product [Adineta steineri]
MTDVLERISNWHICPSAFRARNDAHGIVTQLIDILNRVSQNTTEDDPACQREYERIITLPGQSIGSFYVDLCERLSDEINNAELRCMFPAICNKSIEWDCNYGSGDEFLPKIGELIYAIDSDIDTLSSNSYHATLRTKIGLIGYTSSGKTSLMCRLLGLVRPEPNQFFPVRTTKSTYYPLQYDRPDPLINPYDERTSTAVTFVDIQGSDRGNNISSSGFAAGNYLDEIRKADCDIYVIVFHEDLDNDQYQWMRFIKETMNRRYVLVRSNVDHSFLRKFREKSGVCYGMSSIEERNKFSLPTIAGLRSDFEVDDHDVYLTASDYLPDSTDAVLLLQNEGTQPFDLQQVLDELGRLAPSARHLRVQTLAIRSIARVINSCFRCGYVLNVMKYKIAGGIAAVIPYGDKLPRYLARNSVQEAFGITENFLQYLKHRQISVHSTDLQTLVFQKYVNLSVTPRKGLRLNKGGAGPAVAGIAAVGGSLIDDIVRGAIPALSGGARVATGVAVIGTGIALSAGVCAWSAIKTGKHIFSYTNELCDDLIIISSALVESMPQEQSN